MVGNTSNKNSGALYLSEIFRGLLVWGLWDIPSKVEDKLLHLNPPKTKKKKKEEKWASSEPLWIWRQHISH